MGKPLHPPLKRRKVVVTTVEEIGFDLVARQDFLTGFHKRKLQRAKHARGIAEKKARAERIEQRRKLREERKGDLERHLAAVNASFGPGEQSLDEAGVADDAVEEEQWSGISEPEAVNHEAEYIDEHRYTTVTVEEMDVSRAGLRKAEEESRPESKVPDQSQLDDGSALSHLKKGKLKWTKEKPRQEGQAPRKKSKKFRYENKAERKLTRIKETSKNRTQARARRAG